MPNNNIPLKQGMDIYIEGDSCHLGIPGYNVRVSSMAVIEETPYPTDKRVLITINTIGGDRNVTTTILKDRITKINFVP